ncbi:MAG: LON peptidase substrate-binding domain-containing protein [Verrucomicrobiota bacterium]
MTLPNAVLFPGAMVPLYIYEPRYRRMLTDALGTHRMFCVAMRRAGCKRTLPCPIASVGLIRACVKHKDNTYHLILMGLNRVALGPVLSSRPYRLHEVSYLKTPTVNQLEVQSYVHTLRKVTKARLELGLPFPVSAKPSKSVKSAPIIPTVSEVMEYLDQIKDPDQLADMVAASMLVAPENRQVVLETADLPERLHMLITCLMHEIEKLKGGSGPS